MKSKFFAAIFVAFTFLTLTAAANGRSYAFDFPDLNPARYIANNMDNWLFNVVYGFINRSVTPVLVGCAFDELTGRDANTRVQNCVNKSMFKSGVASGVPASLLGAATTIAVESPQRADVYPVNLAVYVNDLKKDSLIFPAPTYAATWSETVLNSTILGVWKAMRNLAYVLFVLMLVIFGFMVMFRYHLNPQTIITVQDALPRIVINLLLVTFSFPIGAFAISLGPILIWFALTGIGVFTGGSFFSASNAVAIITGIITNILTILVTFAGAATVNPAAGAGALFIIVTWVGLIIGIILALIAAVISLVTRFLRISVMTAFAPLQFAFATLPGQEHLITDWFKSLIGNTLAIPAIFLMLSIGLQFIVLGGGTSALTGSDPLTIVIRGFLGQFLGYAFGLWFIWNARKAPQMIEGAMGIGGGWSPGMAPKPGGKK